MDKKLIRIEWVDAVSHDNPYWFPSDEDPLAPSKCYSVGWVVNETEDSIQIAAHFSEDGEAMCGDICIPRGCITEITEWN